MVNRLKLEAGALSFFLVRSGLGALYVWPTFPFPLNTGLLRRENRGAFIQLLNCNLMNTGDSRVLASCPEISIELECGKNSHG